MPAIPTNIIVEEDYTAEFAEDTANYPYDDQQYTRQFNVTLEYNDYTASEGTKTVHALNAAAEGIPQLWDVHPVNQWAFVLHRQARMGNGPFEVVVTIEYTTIEDPLNADPIIEWGSVRSNEPIDTANDPEDSTGEAKVAIVNSSNESFDPQLTKEVPDKVLRITRNEEIFDHVQAHEYEGAINSDTFWGFDPGKVKCTRYDGRETRAGGLKYWIVTYEFQIRTDSFGWQRRVRDEGFREKTGTDSEGKPTYSTITDEEGKSLSQPSLLDGFGAVLADDSPPVFLYFDVDNKKEFSVLGLE